MAFGWTPQVPALALVSDVIIIGLSYWVFAAGRREFGPSFGKRTSHWTGVFALPIPIAILLAIRDFDLLTHLLPTRFGT